MLSIHLNNVLFHAFHGLYEEEKVLGNDFIVDITIGYQSPAQVASLKETINYIDVYEWVKEKMQTPVPLLETLAISLAHGILEKFSLAEQVTVSIKKLQVPAEQFRGHVGVSFELKRTHHT